MSPSVYEQANIAVAQKLKIGKFIDDHWPDIEKRVFDAESQVAEMERAGKRGASVIFVAECLPFVAGIVHVGSMLEDFRAAKEWVRVELPHADAVSVLSALTFVYLVEKGEQSAIGDPDKLAEWRSIHQRVDSLLAPPQRPPTPTLPPSPTP